MLIAGLGDTLVALTVVIGTDIEDGVVLAVVPSDQFVVFLGKREEAVVTVLMLTTLLHLGQQP